VRLRGGWRAVDKVGARSLARWVLTWLACSLVAARVATGSCLSGCWCCHLPLPLSTWQWAARLSQRETAVDESSSEADDEDAALMREARTARSIVIRGNDNDTEGKKAFRDVYMQILTEAAGDELDVLRLEEMNPRRLRGRSNSMAG